MSTVIVVGAGGTLADAISDGVADGLRPPLDRGFFKQAQTTSKVNFQVVRQYYLKNYGMDLVNTSEDSLEAVLGVLYTDSFQSGIAGLKAFWAFRRLVELLLKELARTTNHLKARESNLIYQAVSRLLDAGEDPKEIRIVTFNYDLHIELALELLARNRPSEEIFAFPNLYCFKPKQCTAPTAGKNNFELSDPGAGAIGLLKLHGSLNWYSRHASKSLSRTELFSLDKEIRVTRRRVIDVDMKVNLPSGKSMSSFPVIIPPVLNKAGVLPQTMKPLWHLAEEALRNADEVVVVGYSCPPTDLESANMIRRAFRTSSKAQHLHIVDPNPSVMMRYVDLTNVQSVSYYRSIEAFLEKWQPERVLVASR